MSTASSSVASLPSSASTAAAATSLHLPPPPSKTLWRLLSLAGVALVVGVIAFIVIHSAQLTPPLPPRPPISKTWKCDPTAQKCTLVDSPDFHTTQAECQNDCAAPSWGCALTNAQGVAGMRTGSCELTQIKNRQCGSTQEACEQGLEGCPSCGVAQSVRCDPQLGCVISTACPAGDPNCWTAAPDRATGTNPAAGNCRQKCVRGFYCEPGQGCRDAGFVANAQIPGPGVSCTKEKPCLGTCTAEHVKLCGGDAQKIKGWACIDKLRCAAVAQSDTTTPITAATLEQCLTKCCGEKPICGTSCMTDNFQCCEWSPATGVPTQHQPFSELACQTCDPKLGVLPTCFGNANCARCLGGKCVSGQCGPNQRCQRDPATGESRCVGACPHGTVLCYDEKSGLTWCVPLNCDCSKTTPAKPFC